jgi:hypothetical protein
LKDNPEKALRAYVAAFESLEPDKVVSFYRLPCMFITPTGVFLIVDIEAARGMVVNLIEQAKSQNYRRTEILDLKVTRLADNIATLAGVFQRFNSSQQEVSRFGFAYTMFHDETNWQIAVGIAHDATPELN